MKRSGMPQQRAPLRRSAVRSPAAAPRRSKAPDIPLATRKAVHERSGGRCEAMCSPVCTGEATEIHHRLPRRYKDHGLLVLVDVCRPCHRWIENNRELAYRLRLLLHEWDPVTKLRAWHR